MPADLDLLLGPEAHALLAAAVAGTGAELVSARPVQVDHRPGELTTVAYAGVLAFGDDLVEETLGASTSAVGDSRDRHRGPVGEQHPGTVSVTDGEVVVTVWRMPDDPGLPGLAAACSAEAVEELLRTLGADPSGLVLYQHGYRPRRRAVIEAWTPTGSLWLKVVRPHRVRDLHERHALMSGADLPTPRSLGWTEDGVLVLEALRGVPLREVLVRGGQPLPTGAELVALLDGIPASAASLPARPSWTTNADHYADQLSVALPEVADRARAAGARIVEGCEGMPADDVVHGDFYETQILLAGGRVSGLLDLDAVGPGRRADDLACLVAHAVVLADMGLVSSSALEEALDQWLPAFDERVDPAELRTRVAGVLLSLATGPHRVQDDDWQAATVSRLELVDRWVGAARHGTVPV